jgi:zinc transporter ZupT
LDPTLFVLLSSAVAALMAGLGPLPLLGRDRLPTVAIGWANALAAGLMLGPAYLLMAAGLAYLPTSGALGAVLGIGFVWLTHHAAGTEDLDLNQRERVSDVYGYQVMLINTLHSAWEGVAIGAAMGVGLPFGAFMAVAIGVHNVPEATVLSAILRERGVRGGQAAMLSIATDVPQVLMAVVVFSVVRAAPAFLPWSIGFAFGSLVYLVLAELLPQCYRQAGRTSMALVTLVAMGMVVLLGGLAG